MESSKWNGVEVRTLPVIGTHYREHSIWVDGVKIHAQLQPYGNDEIKQRVASYRNPSAARPFKATDFHSKDKTGKAAKYEWRTGSEE